MDEPRKPKDKRLLTLIIMFFPSIILMALSNVQDMFMRFGIQFLVIFYQLIVMWNLVNEYYGDEYGLEESEQTD